jgi:hypothetical protein
VQYAVAGIVPRPIQFGNKLFAILSGARGMLTRFRAVRGADIAEATE